MQSNGSPKSFRPETRVLPANFTLLSQYVLLSKHGLYNLSTSLQLCGLNKDKRARTAFDLNRIHYGYTLATMWNHAAFVDEKSAPTIVREAPYPDLKPGHVIIKNAAIALNHIDWKLQDFGFLVQSWPTVLGRWHPNRVLFQILFTY